MQSDEKSVSAIIFEHENIFYEGTYFFIDYNAAITGRKCKTDRKVCAKYGKRAFSIVVVNSFMNAKDFERKLLQKTLKNFYMHDYEKPSFLLHFTE